jgi:hypothetical protein
VCQYLKEKVILSSLRGVDEKGVIEKHLQAGLKKPIFG